MEKKLLHKNIKVLKQKLSKSSEKTKVETLCELGKLYLESKKEKEFLKTYEQALEESRKISFYEMTAKISFSLGNFYHKKDNFKEALKHYNEALEIYEKLKDQIGFAKTLSEIGTVEVSIGNYSLALKNHLKSLEIFEKLEDQNEVAIQLTNIGLVNQFLREFDTSLEYLFDALKFLENSEDRIAYAKALSYIGISYYGKEEEKCLEFYQKALEIFEEEGEEDGVISQSANIGIAYLSLENFKLALKFLRKPLSYYRKKNSKYQLAICLLNIGNCQIYLDKLDESIETFLEALDLAEELDSKNLASQISVSISQAYELKGNYERSLAYFKKFSQTKDKVFNEELKAQTAEMQTRYETEKKEREAEIYKLKNVELVKLNDKLSKTLQELKEAQEQLVEAEKNKMFLAMVTTANHQLNQPLSVIQGNLELIKHKTYQKLDQETKIHLDKISKNVFRCSEILRSLGEIKKPDYISYIGKVNMVELKKEK
ncbi:MAG: tetratricopeptide repeat protein [Calditrichaeota bacterium]|nr:MAG: tetratricopeptide repeat protein [Calditrichota bacterium]